MTSAWEIQDQFWSPSRKESNLIHPPPHNKSYKGERYIVFWNMLNWEKSILTSKSFKNPIESNSLSSTLRKHWLSRRPPPLASDTGWAVHEGNYRDQTDPCPFIRASKTWGMHCSGKNRYMRQNNDQLRNAGRWILHTQRVWGNSLHGWGHSVENSHCSHSSLAMGLHQESRMK